MPNGKHLTKTDDETIFKDFIKQKHDKPVATNIFRHGMTLALVQYAYERGHRDGKTEGREGK